MKLNIHKLANRKQLYLTVFKYEESRTWCFEIHDALESGKESWICDVEGESYQKAEDATRSKIKDIPAYRRAHYESDQPEY